MKFLFAIMIIVTGLNIFTAIIIRNYTVIVQYASEKQKVSCEAAVRHNTRIRLMKVTRSLTSEYGPECSAIEGYRKFNRQEPGSCLLTKKDRVVARSINIHLRMCKCENVTATLAHATPSSH